MIYGRLGSLHHRPPPPLPRVGARYVHTCPVRVYVYAYIRVHDGGRRSEWVATVEARVIREFIGACYAYYSSAWKRGGENCRSRETSFIISKKKSRCIGHCPTTPAELLSPFPTLGDQCCPLSPDSSLPRIDAVFHVSRPVFRLAENFPILLYYLQCARHYPSSS